MPGQRAHSILQVALDDSDAFDAAAAVPRLTDAGLIQISLCRCVRWVGPSYIAMTKVATSKSIPSSVRA